MANKESQKTAQRIERDRLRSFQARQAQYESKIVRRKRDNRTWGIIAGVVIILAIGSQVLFTALTPSTTHTLPNKSLAQNKSWMASLGINNTTMSVELNGKAAPQAVASTIALAKSGFYSGISCHRLVTEGIYVLQCGDPKGDGTGGPGYNYGPVENAPADNVYPAGTIAMARSGNNAASQGSQFFIVYKTSTIPADTAGGYTVIGNVTSGLDQLVSNVISVGVANGATDGAPAKPITLKYFDIFG